MLELLHPKHANIIIIEDGVKELEMYDELSQNSAPQKAMEEEIIALAKSNLGTNVTSNNDQTYILQVGLQNKVSTKWINREIQGSTCSLRVLSTIWTRL